MSIPNMPAQTFYDNLASILNGNNGYNLTNIGGIIKSNNYDPMPLSVDEGKDGTFRSVCWQNPCPCGFPCFGCTRTPTFGCDKHFGVRGRVNSLSGLQNMFVTVNDSTTAFSGKTGFYKCDNSYYLLISLSISFKNTFGNNQPTNIIVKGGYTLYCQDFPDINQEFTVVANNVVVNFNLLIPVGNANDNWGISPIIYDKIDTFTKITIGTVTYPDYPSGIFGDILNYCKNLFQPVLDSAFAVVRVKVQDIINGPLNNVLKSKIKDLILSNSTLCPGFLLLDPASLINACAGKYEFDRNACLNIENCPATKLTLVQCNELLRTLNFTNPDGSSAVTTCRASSYKPSTSIWKKAWFIVLVSIIGVLVLFLVMRGYQKY